MRRKLFSGLGLAILVFLAGIALASTAMAQTATPPAKDSANADIIKTLRSAHRLLAEADRDYEGHRAKAAHEVVQAMKELGYHHHKKLQPNAAANEGTAVPPKKAAAGQEKMHEPQATSDAQLRQARQILQGLLTQLNDHPKAAANVKAAIAEIITALSIK